MKACYDASANHKLFDEGDLLSYKLLRMKGLHLKKGPTKYSKK